MDKFIALLEAILASSIFWGVVALMALALALSGKLSVSAAITVLWLAWATAVFGIYRAEIVAKLDPVIKYLGLVMVASGLAIGAVMIGRWLEKPQEKPQETTASKLTTPTSDTGKPLRPALRPWIGHSPFDAPATAQQGLFLPTLRLLRNRVLDTLFLNYLPHLRDLPRSAVRLSAPIPRA